MSIGDHLKQQAQRLLSDRSIQIDPVDMAPISIVVPGRNVETTVKRTLDSVLAQTSERWELVFVDDGSTDTTAEIVEAAVGGRANVQIVKGPGEGVSAARNLGIELARLDHVLFLDADDWIDSRFVELMGSALSGDPSLAGVRCIWAYETPDGRTQAWDDLDLSDFFGAAAARCPFAIHACVINRELVRSLGGFDTGLVVGEDWDLWQRVGRAGAKLGFVPEVMAYYYMRMESVMHCDLARSQSDLLVVARRGTESDDRVKAPTPKYRDGLPADPLLDLEAETLAGTLAVAIPTGADFKSLLPPYPPDNTKTITGDHIAGALHEAVAFGSCALLDDWVELYALWESRIHEMLDVLCGWLGQPELIYDVLRELEAIIASSIEVDGLELIGRTAVQSIDLQEDLSDIHPPDVADQLIAAVRHREVPIGFVRIPVIGGVLDAKSLASTNSIEHCAPIARQPRKDMRLARHLVPGLLNRQVLKSGARFLLDLPWSKRTGSRNTTDQFLRWSSRQASAMFLDARVPADKQVGQADDVTVDDSTTTDLAPADSDSDLYDEGYGAAYFDGIFEEPDPWSYSGNYEQTKYEQTLEVLGDQRFHNGLELACAEGHFTVQLADRVDQLVAADISPTALTRAAERCADHDGIDFRQLDLRHDEFPPGLDLIVCSEVLYFMESEEALKDVSKRFADALVPGGLLVMAHANLVVDDPALTGFEWEHEFGARRIGEIVSSIPGLRLVSTSISELYRIHLIERVEGPGDSPLSTEIEVPYASELDPHIARMALWGGAVVLRQDAYANEIGYQLPILMYHRIAPTGVAGLETYRVNPESFEEQLNYLRANGYYGITFEQWQYALQTHRPLPGRPVLLTFDDGYRDFYEHAWPLLRDYDFTATVFVVADLVGGIAAWDERYGEPPPLMNWDEIRYVQSQGIEIGSHTASHRSLTSLKPSEALAQERRAQKIFKRELGSEISVLAYPFGEHDELVQATMARVGYEVAVTTQGWLATVWHNPMALPRVDIAHQDDLSVFASKLGNRGAVNPVRRGLRQLRQRSLR